MYTIYKTFCTFKYVPCTWPYCTFKSKAYNLIIRFRFMLMMLNATFNNISVISWWSTNAVEETGVPGEKHHPVASH